ncbi:MAG: hypothetical protein SNF33_07835 [Candidatus Algichlamydia australiensis]|nr:hypothetical protein [Chlamydiales bacterium]
MLKLPTAIHYVCSEEQLCHELNLGYFRIPVTDHIRPSNEMVDRFIAFTKGLPEKSHLHFHCSSGVGRATTFLCLYDMMKNANNVSFEEIITRQQHLGGINLINICSPSKWKYQHQLNRAIFLKQFYTYVRENSDNFTTTFTEWSSRSRNLTSPVFSFKISRL